MKITCTEKQALIIEIALDTLSRMTCGQLREIVSGIECYRQKIFKLDYLQQEELDNTLKKLKEILFPELDYNAFYGVGMKEIGDAQIAYECVKVLQNFRSRKLSEEEGRVLKHKPLHYSKEKLIKVEE